MKGLGLLGVLIVLVAIGALVAYWWSYMAGRRAQRRAAETPWMAHEGLVDGKWVISAHRPGHETIVLASQTVEDGFMSTAIHQARSDAYENFMVLKPRGRWDLS